MRVVLLALAVVALAAPEAFAEDPIAKDAVAAADALPDDQALDALVALWERVQAGASIERDQVFALHGALLRRWVAKGKYGEATPHAQALARDRNTQADAVRYVEVLLGSVEERLARGPSISANISPLLADILQLTSAFAAKKGGGLEEALRPRLVYVRARTLFLRARHDDAVAWLADADIASLPEAWRPRLWDHAARSHYEMKRFGSAAEAFARGGNARAAAAAWAAAKDKSQTAASYAALLAQSPTDEQLATAALRAVRFAGATEDFLARVAALPESARNTPVLLELRGRLLDSTEQTREALALWRRLYEKAPERPGIRGVLARALIASPQGNTAATLDEAMGLLEEALRADPEDDLSTRLLWSLAGRDYSALWRDSPQRERYRRCVRAQRALVAARPDDATAWANLGNTLRVGGRADEAVTAYERAREENPYDPAIVSDLGLALAALGRSEEALAAFEESVRLDSGHLAGHQNAARMLWRAGRDADAAAHLAVGARTSRARGRTGMTYRVLMDRTWRTRRNARLR